MWQIKRMKYLKNKKDKEILLNSKLDKTDYNKFIEKQNESNEKNKLRNRERYAKNKEVKQKNIIVIDDIKNNNSNEIDTKIIENVENMNMVPKTVKKTPKKSFSITNSSETQNNIINVMDTPSKKDKIISKKKQLLYTSALSPTILSFQSNKNLIDTPL